MRLHLKTLAALNETHDGLILGIGANQCLNAAAAQLDESLDGAIARIVQQSGFEGKTGQILNIYQVPGIQAPWLILVGTGQQGELTPAQWVKMVQSAYKSAADLKLNTVVLGILDPSPQSLNPIEAFTLASRTLRECTYHFSTYKSQPVATHTPKDMTLVVQDKSLLTNFKQALHWTEAVAEGTALCRQLGNLPGNVCTPAYLSEQAQQLSKLSKKVKIKVLGEAQLEKMGAGAFMAVSRGSNEEGRLVLIEYRGAPNQKGTSVALIGKGITFDSGGISIKPAAGMDEMKFDMCGAATVMGVMRSLIRADLPLNVVGVLACAENMPSGNATRPGDIVSTLSGKTVEILNTDAEGRLVLCDALTYTQQQYHPDIMIDIATLTGACVVALGKVTSGLFSTDDALADELLEAGRLSQDHAWRLPLATDYQELLDSPAADMANIGGPTAGAITAACFLSRFVEGTRWAHLDIAGTAWLSGPKKGATGRPVPLLTEFLKRQIHA